jgi:hypothetical protein
LHTKEAERRLTQGSLRYSRQRLAVKHQTAAGKSWSGCDIVSPSYMTKKYPTAPSERRLEHKAREPRETT